MKVEIVDLEELHEKLWKRKSIWGVRELSEELCISRNSSARILSKLVEKEYAEWIKVSRPNRKVKLKPPYYRVIDIIMSKD
jgi:DNA-binding MarR family transcriptional regulator